MGALPSVYDAISPEIPNRIAGGTGTYGTILSFLPNNFPDGNGKFIVSEDGRKLREPPLLRKWGHACGQRSHRTC